MVPVSDGTTTTTGWHSRPILALAGGSSFAIAVLLLLTTAAVSGFSSFPGRISRLPDSTGRQPRGGRLPITALGVATTTNSTTSGKKHGIRIEKPKPKRKPPQPRVSKNQEALSERKFPRTWVPLASVYELDPDRPTPLVFLDQAFVCYKQTPSGNHEDDWIVMDDVCPHRLVPLSEGRINRPPAKNDEAAKATIQCSYHGWEFAGDDGRCLSIPQAGPRVKANAEAHPRAAVTTYSTRVHKNILWFWPWADKDPLELLGEYPRGHPEGIMGGIANTDDGGPSRPTTYTRDLPYGWDTLLENLIDPAHIPFAHHNLQGKREDAIPISMTVPEPLPRVHNENVGNNDTIGNHRTAAKDKNGDAAGFVFEWQDRTMGKHRAGTGEFQAPFGIAYEGLFYGTKEEADASRKSHLARKRAALSSAAAFNATATSTTAAATNSQSSQTAGLFRLGVLCIPTKPGWSRAIILTGGQEKPPPETTKRVTSSTTTKQKEDKSPQKKKKKKKSLIGLVFAIVPPWLLHLVSNRFLDSDLAFLHFQEQERQRYHDDIGQTYFMPAQADRCVASLRRWIPRHTDYLEEAAARLPPPQTDRTVLFDRYQQHTSHCRHCRAGLSALSTLKRRARAGLVSSVLATHWLQKGGWGLAAKLAALVCGGILWLVAALEPAFRVGGFDHATNN